MSDLTNFAVPGAAFPSAPDGLAIDLLGNIYVAAIGAQAVLKIKRRTGEPEILASEDPYDWPSSLAFGTARGERRTLFSVNFSVGEDFGDPRSDRAGPGVVAVRTRIPGAPVPPRRFRHRRPRY